MMISNVRGQFTGISGALTLDESDLTNSRVEASIDADTIHTRDAQRDAHLKSADFFDVQKFPTLNFQSKSVRRSSGGGLALVSSRYGLIGNHASRCILRCDVVPRGLVIHAPIRPPNATLSGILERIWRGVC